MEYHLSAFTPSTHLKDKKYELNLMTLKYLMNYNITTASKVSVQILLTVRSTNPSLQKTYTSMDQLLCSGPTRTTFIIKKELLAILLVLFSYSKSVIKFLYSN